ncbi:Drug/metabolite transporter [Macleaya cordata]|uniref:Probable purine permease n=1 Tax=Macleaya cordata TaxID=56857 RepID=A0A200Q9L1_MACCD|nr:Drug/metabolite transporter [Macleaya cordata]
MSIEMIEEGVINHQAETNQNKLSAGHGDYEHHEDYSKKSLMAKWGLLFLYCICSAVGTIGGPLLLRLYFLHGGNRKWLSSGLQTAGFPILVIPLAILYFKRDRTPCSVQFFASPKLLLSSIIIGILLGVNNFMYSYGLSFLPVSTSSILISTQLIFTALFAFIMVRQKFSPYSINSIVVMTLGSVLLGFGKSGDRPEGVSSSQYLLGFILSIGAAALGGFVLPCTEVAYAKASKVMTYPIVLQYQFCMALSATIFCIIGMLVNKDFSAMQREANDYELGATKYYLVLVSSAVVWQVMYIGTLGIIFCTTSLFAGVISAVLLPLTEIAAVIVFHEKFTGEKGMALALGLWGFSSYFYGSYRETKNQTKRPREDDTSK